MNGARTEPMSESPKVAGSVEEDSSMVMGQEESDNVMLREVLDQLTVGVAITNDMYRSEALGEWESEESGSDENYGSKSPGGQILSQGSEKIHKALKRQYLKNSKGEFQSERQNSLRDAVDASVILSNE